MKIKEYLKEKNEGNVCNYWTLLRFKERFSETLDCSQKYYVCQIHVKAIINVNLFLIGLLMIQLRYRTLIKLVPLIYHQLWNVDKYLRKKNDSITMKVKQTDTESSRSQKIIKKKKSLSNTALISPDWLLFVFLIFGCKSKAIFFSFFCFLFFISEHWKVTHIETSFSLTQCKNATEFFWHPFCLPPSWSHIIFKFKKDFDLANSIKLYFQLIKSGTLEHRHERKVWISSLMPMLPEQHS